MIQVVNVGKRGSSTDFSTTIMPFIQIINFQHVSKPNNKKMSTIGQLLFDSGQEGARSKELGAKNHAPGSLLRAIQTVVI